MNNNRVLTARMIMREVGLVQVHLTEERQPLLKMVMDHKILKSVMAARKKVAAVKGDQIQIQQIKKKSRHPIKTRNRTLNRMGITRGAVLNKMGRRGRYCEESGYGEVTG